jgi:formylmethanofuran dehydrogenase subunit E
MGVLGASWLGLELPNVTKRLLVIVETDGCFADGIAAATGCSIGARTLRVIDHGKVAAVFVDVKTDHAVRIVPQPQTRERAFDYAPGAPSKWHAQRDGYQLMPDDELLTVRSVKLAFSLEQLLSKPGCKAVCSVCGEEIINEREVRHGNQLLCRACAGDSYWRE